MEAPVRSTLIFPGEAVDQASLAAWADDCVSIFWTDGTVEHWNGAGALTTFLASYGGQLEVQAGSTAHRFEVIESEGAHTQKAWLTLWTPNAATIRWNDGVLEDHTAEDVMSKLVAQYGFVYNFQALDQ